MLPCWPFPGLVFGCISFQSSYQLHKPRATVPALAGRFSLGKQLCHKSTACPQPLLIAQNMNVSPGQSSMAFPSLEDARLVGSSQIQPPESPGNLSMNEAQCHVPG